MRSALEGRRRGARRRARGEEGDAEESERARSVCRRRCGERVAVLVPPPPPPAGAAERRGELDEGVVEPAAAAAAALVGTVVSEKERMRVERQPSWPKRVRSRRDLYSSLAGVVSMGGSPTDEGCEVGWVFSFLRSALVPSPWLRWRLSLK